MFGLVDKSLSGDGEFEEQEAGQLGFKTGILPADTVLTSYNDGSKTTYQKGTVVRVYTGQIPAGGGKYFTSPTNSIYVVELPPTAESKYWNVYPMSEEIKTLMSSQEWKDTESARRGRLFTAKLPPSKLGSMEEIGLDEGKVNNEGLPKGQPGGTALAEGGKAGGGPLPGEGEGHYGEGGGKDKPPEDDNYVRPPPEEPSYAGLWILLAVAAFFFFAAREEKKTRKQLKAEK